MTNKQRKTELIQKGREFPNDLTVREAKELKPVSLRYELIGLGEEVQHMDPNTIQYELPTTVLTGMTNSQKKKLSDDQKKARQTNIDNATQRRYTQRATAPSNPNREQFRLKQRNAVKKSRAKAKEEGRIIDRKTIPTTLSGDDVVELVDKAHKTTTTIADKVFAFATNTIDLTKTAISDANGTKSIGVATPPTESIEDDESSIPTTETSETATASKPETEPDESTTSVELAPVPEVTEDKSSMSPETTGIGLPFPRHIIFDSDGNRRSWLCDDDSKELYVFPASNDSEKAATYAHILESALRYWGATGIGLKTLASSLQHHKDPSKKYDFGRRGWEAIDYIMKIRGPLCYDANINHIKNPRKFEEHFRYLCGQLYPTYEIFIKCIDKKQLVGIQQEEMGNLRSTIDNQRSTIDNQGSMIENQRQEIERLNCMLRKRKYESYYSESQYGYESAEYQYDEYDHQHEEPEFVSRKRMKMSHDGDYDCRNNRQGGW